MNMKIFYLTFVIASHVLLMLLIQKSSFANDSAAEVAASGIQFKQEKSISIEKEELFISEKKIEVSYLFKNYSDKDITTEIAFPVPEYNADDAESGLPFKKFTVEVNSQKLKYSSEIRALVHGKDYSKVLKQMGISIHDFGGFSPPIYAEMHPKNFFSTLSKKDQQTLRKYGLVSNDGYPQWKVSIKHHWTQTFPANSFVIIKHVYTPWWGYTYFGHDELENNSSYLYKDACITEKIKQWIKQSNEPIFVTIIGYILTTANNWRSPIKDFIVTIDTDAKAKISTCFDYELTQKSDSRYESHIKNFIPKKDLKIYYFRGAKQKQKKYFKSF
jgi:hypothetical protein